MRKFLNNDKGVVFSFEPFKKNYFRLVENIIYNDISNIVPLRIALSDSIGIALISKGEHSGSESVIQNGNNKIYNLSEKCFTTTMDKFSLTFGINNIDLLKIDAEGFDGKILEGGEGLLRNQKIDYIIIEYNQDTECTSKCMDIFDRNNYDVFYIVRNSGYLVKELNEYPFDTFKPPLNLLAISKFANGRKKVIETL